jgi:lipopolysaccharide heptosyltransferase II
MDSSYDLQMIQVIQRRQFDAAVIFTVFSQSPLPAALMTYQANIPLRLACSRENPYQLLTDWVHETEPNKNIRHEVRRQLDLVASVGCTLIDERLHVQVNRANLLTAENILASHLEGGKRPWIVIHPGASAPSRRYPPEGYAIIVDQLYEKYGFISILTGGQGEVDLVEDIRMMANVPSISLAGQLTVAELAAVISKAPLMISNNTGPVHLAAAVGTPIVDLYALTNPQHIPWGVPNRVLSHDVPCKYCFKSTCPLGHHNCLRLVKPARVISAVCDLLQEVAQPELGLGVSG